MIDTVLIASNADWSGMMLQKQQWAIRFAQYGLPVYYINKTPQRSFHIPDLLRLPDALKGKGIQQGHIRHIVDVPPGVKIINLPLLPPGKVFDIYNSGVITKLARKIKSCSGQLLFITYTPSPAMYLLKNLLKPAKSAYVCVHHYEAYPGISRHFLAAEKKLAHEVDDVFCDSHYLAEKWTGILQHQVKRLMPACNPELFRAAWRGDEHTRLKTVGFFGASFSDLDLNVYERVADAGYKLIFIGPKNLSVDKSLGQKVSWHPAVPNEKLPRYLFDIDVLLVAYKDIEKIRGVIPAKFFECLATGKPLLISPLPDMVSYKDVVHIVDGPDAAITVLSRLQELETDEIRQKRWKIAGRSSWENRFSQLIQDLNVESLTNCHEKRQ